MRITWSNNIENGFPTFKAHRRETAGIERLTYMTLVYHLRNLSIPFPAADMGAEYNNVYKLAKQRLFEKFSLFLLFADCFCFHKKQKASMTVAPQDWKCHYQIW